MVADTSLDFIHGCGAQFRETAGPSRPPIHKGSSAVESAYDKNCVDRCSQVYSEENYGECVVAIHVPPIKGTAQVTFKILHGTKPTLSMPMLVANGNKVAFRGEGAELITAKGETAPVTSEGDDLYLKVLNNNNNEFIGIDARTPCHVCPPSRVRNLSPEMKQREQYVVRETTTTGRKDSENSRKSMQSTGTWEMEVLRSLLNPEEKDDTELLKDLSSPGKPPSFDGKVTMPINTAVDTRETSILESRQ